MGANVLPKENIYYSEFSSYGKQQINDLGVQCFSLDIHALSQKEFEGNFNAVCMFHVQEHMDKLEELFTKLNWLLKKGGNLFIAVPNQGRIEFNELHGALLDMPPNHIGRWNKNCFEQMDKQNGFHLQDYKREESHLLPMAKQFVNYRYLRNAQESGSVENKIETKKNKSLTKIMKVIGIAVNSRRYRNG